MEETQIITPWKATSSDGFNYLKLIDQFGCSPVSNELINKFERVTGIKAHTWLRRGRYFSHKDLDLVLDDYESGKQIYIYTGRGPSSESMHLGHMIPFVFTKYLQDAFNAIVIIQMSDDEKYYFNGQKTGNKLSYYNDLSRKNALDIIACGFNIEKTYIFSNLEQFGGALYRITAEIMVRLTGNQVKGIFGLNLDNNIGELFWPAAQAAPAFSQAFPDLFSDNCRCLVPMAIDQSPYFRLARDFAEKFHVLKPAEIHAQFLPSLFGINNKMSSSDAQNGSIFLTDTPDIIETKIKKYAYSGGGKTLQEHRQLGADLNVDVAYQYLLYFLDDDKELEKIAREYKSGRMLTSDIKKIMIDCVLKFVNEHQERREQITQEIIDKFFDRNREFDNTTIKREPYIGDNVNCGFDFDTLFE